MPLEFSIIDAQENKLWDYGWFDRTRFSASGYGDRSPAGCIDAFLKDPISQRTFCTPGPWGEDGAGHGPFNRGEMNATWFSAITQSELVADVQRVLADPEFTEPPSAQQQEPLSTWLNEVECRDDKRFKAVPPESANALIEIASIWLVYSEYLC